MKKRNGGSVCEGDRNIRFSCHSAVLIMRLAAATPAESATRASFSA